jgi:ribosomal protein L22
VRAVRAREMRYYEILSRTQSGLRWILSSANGGRQLSRVSGATLQDSVFVHPERGLATLVSEIPDPHASIRASATQRRRWPRGVDGEPIRTANAKRLGISTSPHKLNLVARLVRGLSVDEAQRQLMGTVKKHRTEVADAIRTAVTNARSFGMVEDRLIVSRAYVNKGKYLKRLRPWHGKGRFGIEHKKYTHLCVEVQELNDEQWESRVMPQYVHMKYRPDSDKPRKLPKRIVAPWTVRSQLDLSLEETKRRSEAVRALLPKKKHPFPEGWEAKPELL